MTVMEINRYHELQSDKEVLLQLLEFLRRDKLRLMEQAAAAKHASTLHETLYAAVDLLHSRRGRAGALAAIEHIVVNMIGAEKYALIEGTGGAECATEGALACIPLEVDGENAGSIAIFSLRDSKTEINFTDRALFDVLSKHAAVALQRT